MWHQEEAGVFMIVFAWLGECVLGNSKDLYSYCITSFWVTLKIKLNLEYGSMSFSLTHITQLESFK